MNKEKGFIPASEIFYNHKFLQISNYQDFQNAVFSLTDVQTPQKQILNYLKEEPFKVDSSDLLDFGINDNTELSLEDIKTILDFCKSNNESFFQNCIIEKQGKNYYISSKAKNVFQVFPSSEARKFIESNLADTFKILPYELDDYKDENGVLFREPFYNQIIDSVYVDIDFYQTELVDIIAYDNPKRKFLLKLSEIRFDSSKEYNKESFEHKIVNLACNALRKEDYAKFKVKIIIETEEQEFKLTEIPPFIDKVEIHDSELSLAKILPNQYQNSDHISNLTHHFINNGINREQINSLFGIEDELEISDIFKLFSEETSILENAEQLAFVLLYNKYIENIDLSPFKVETLGDKYTLNNYSYYTREFPFLIAGATLSEKYKGLEKIFQTLPVSINVEKEIFLLKEPFFTDDKFICPNLDTDLSNEQKLSLIDFLFNQWDKKNKKTTIRNLDWTSINEIETKNLLGFNPNHSVYPSKYALESEKLPEYLQKWLGEDNAKINFISDFSVFTEKSTLVSLRKFFLNEGDFNKNRLAQENRFADEKILFNTFEWLKSKSLELDSTEEFEVFKEIVRVINSRRVKGRDLIVEEEYDFELLQSDEVKEWNIPYYQSWKKELENKFSIYLFDGSLPRVVKLDEIGNYVFYRFNQGNSVIDTKNNIYINKNIDIKKALSSLISESNNFTTDDLLRLYQSEENKETKNDEVIELKSENERLRQRISELEGVSRTATYSPTVSSDDNYHDEIKEKSEAYLFEILKKKYPLQVVKWLNYNEATATFKESWKHHDFEIQDENGTILHYIDCKGTPQKKKTFYLTSNEWSFFLDCVKNEESYQIYRVYDMEGNANFVQIDNLWGWIENGKVVPYLSATETIKGGRVFLTLL